MRIDWDTPIDVLMHVGDINCIDLDPDVLVHWKYIKREKLPNGKWRYYYRDTDYEKIRDEYLDESNQQNELSKRFKKYTDFVGLYTAQLDKVNNGDKAATDANQNLRGWKEMRDEIGEEMNASYWKLKRIKPQYEAARDHYARSAGHKVANLLNKASDKIYNAKQWLKGLFG